MCYCRLREQDEIGGRNDVFVGEDSYMIEVYLMQSFIVKYDVSAQ